MQLADALSRCPARASQEIKLDMRVDYIAFTKPWIEKLKDSTQRDPILATVYQLTQQGWPHQRRHVPRLARRYWDFRDELSTDDGLLLKGPRLIIPGELQEEYLSRLHEGHLSANKVQENAKHHMYWTGIDADIEDYTKRCQECCTVPLSLFADPEQILRRLYVFAEEPGKSTTATSEPCSPVFKEVQPRPSGHSNLEYHINNLNLYLYVFGLFIIYYCNKSYPTRL